MINIDSSNSVLNNIVEDIQEVKLLNVCTYADLFSVDKISPLTTNFCTKFSGYDSTKERMQLLIDEYHWNLNEKGNWIEVLAIEPLKKCSEFVTLSPDGIRIWKLLSIYPNHYKIQKEKTTKESLLGIFGMHTKTPQILMFKISHNNEYLVYGSDCGDLYLLNFNSRIPITLHNEKCNEYGVENIVISNDDQFIALKIEKAHRVVIYEYKSHKQVQLLEGIIGKIRLLEFDGDQKDIILCDNEGVKIYFLGCNKPAYFIKDLRQLNKLKKKYYKLEIFRKFFK